MKEDSLLVSVITITYNSAKTIEDTLLSILGQTYDNIEYIVADGKSTDNTLEIIESYRNQFLKKGISMTILSEKDTGIADAWNKGISRAKGKIIGLLNSDDWYENTTVEKISHLLNPKEKQLSYGICKRVDGHKNVTSTLQTNFFPKRVYLDFGFSHTTCFVTKKTYDELGNFDTDFKIAMDVDFLLRCLKKGVLFRKADNITYMRVGGISTANRMPALLEHQEALKKNGYNRLLIFIFGLLKKLILLVKK